MPSNVTTLSPKPYSLNPRSHTCSLHGELVFVRYILFTQSPPRNYWFTKKKELQWKLSYREFNSYIWVILQCSFLQEP